jgi:hypothetical protein
MWSWGDKYSYLIPKLYPKKALMEGGNKNLMVYKKKKFKMQKFDFDEINGLWEATYRKNVLKA